VKGVKSCCISNVLDGLMMICCIMAVSVRKMKVLTVKMETVTVIGKGRQNVTRFVY
jgi:hypothetical protein